MNLEREPSIVTAAQAGQQWAQDQLVAAYLPLVYNIAGRALGGHADVDDVVQEAMIRALTGLGSLRDPGSFRSWLVAITMNQIRGHLRAAGHPGQAPGDPWEAREVADPGADFVDLTIVRLGLSGQRRETAEATRWLDPDDRTLLSLWWLEAAGELTRAEVAAAMELSPQHTAVRVQRMKAQLETARLVVRALSAAPRCVLLDDLLAGWDGAPSALWRKRLARHARDCTVCAGHQAGLVPAEGLLVGLGLVPVAAGLLTALGESAGPLADAAYGAPARHPAAHPADRAAGGPAGPGTEPIPVAADAGTVSLAAGGRRDRRRDAAARRRRAALTAGAVALLVGGGGVTGLMLLAPDDDPADEVRTQAAAPSSPSLPASTPPASASASPSAAASASASPSPSASTAKPTTSPKPSRKPRPSASATTKAPPAPAPSRTTRRPQPPAPRPSDPPAPTGSFGRQVTALVNAERQRSGCGPVSQNSLLDTAAQRHSADMAARDYFDHTSPDGRSPGDRVTAAGYRWSTYGENIARGQQTPASVMDSWMNSPGHRANILNCSFKEIGVGKHDGSGGPWWTQVFGASM
ncbi:sigma-70 family RNA polymerase sigma factor [Streptomyces sp. ODS05-4]|uniref:sigma-70 family RNA polymerase sigma factor n=1 Tax=Streptomyces sp. ODS05-4 TaxID=2944939 RepID=UPI00210B5C86|nr:sigma-70 family RNA polymerase sigma factor [Streptomyces sp. ODS05-4]